MSNTKTFLSGLAGLLLVLPAAAVEVPAVSCATAYTAMPAGKIAPMGRQACQAPATRLGRIRNDTVAWDQPAYKKAMPAAGSISQVARVILPVTVAGINWSMPLGKQVHLHYDLYDAEDVELHDEMDQIDPQDIEPMRRFDHESGEFRPESWDRRQKPGATEWK